MMIFPKDNPTVVNTPFTYSSSIDYVGDVDYYTFTNLGGYYDIYSTGYGNGNIDMKAELCEDSSCLESTILVSNDDHGNLNESDYINKFKTSYSGMGIYDFGFRIDLGYRTIGQEYILKVYHFNNSVKGNYTVNFNYIGEKYLPLFNSDGSTIGYGVKWSYDKDMSYLGDSVCKLTDVSIDSWTHRV